MGKFLFKKVGYFFWRRWVRWKGESCEWKYSIDDFFFLECLFYYSSDCSFGLLFYCKYREKSLLRSGYVNKYFFN